MPLYYFTPNDLGRCFCAQGNEGCAHFAAADIAALLEDTFAPYFLQTARFNADEIFDNGGTSGTLRVTCPAVSVPLADYAKLMDAKGHYNGPTRTLEIGTLRLGLPRVTP